MPLRDLVEEVSVELPGDSLVKLGMVKVMNFNWRRFEVQLVSLLLRKATSLNKLLLVSPNVAPLQVPGVQEDNLLLKETLASGRIIVSESDDPAIQPFILRSLSRSNFLCLSICSPVDHNSGALSVCV